MWRRRESWRSQLRRMITCYGWIATAFIGNVWKARVQKEMLLWREWHHPWSSCKRSARCCSGVDYYRERTRCLWKIEWEKDPGGKQCTKLEKSVTTSFIEMPLCNSMATPQSYSKETSELKYSREQWHLDWTRRFEQPSKSGFVIVGGICVVLLHLFSLVVVVSKKLSTTFKIRALVKVAGKRLQIEEWPWASEMKPRRSSF